MSEFAKAFEYLLEDEGREYVNDPADPGGPTKFGVTQKAYASYLCRPVFPDEIEKMTENEAHTFYWAEFWSKLNLSEVQNDAIAISIFDTCILYGLNTGGRMVQGALGFTQRDGIVGPNTIAALNKEDVKSFLGWLHDRVCSHIGSIVIKNSRLQKFEKGWIARADRILTIPLWLTKIKA